MPSNIKVYLVREEGGKMGGKLLCFFGPPMTTCSGGGSGRERTHAGEGEGEGEETLEKDHLATTR